MQTTAAQTSSPVVAVAAKDKAVTVHNAVVSYSVGKATFAQIKRMPFDQLDVLSTNAACALRAADGVANVAIGELFVSVFAMFGADSAKFDGKAAWAVVKDKLCIQSGEKHKAQSYWSFFVRSVAAGQADHILAKGILSLQREFPSPKRAAAEVPAQTSVTDSAQADTADSESVETTPPAIKTPPAPDAAEVAELRAIIAAHESTIDDMKTREIGLLLQLQTLREAADAHRVFVLPNVSENIAANRAAAAH